MSFKICLPPGWKSIYRVTLYTTPRIAIQASFLVLCFESSSGVTGIIRPWVPDRSTPELPKRIQSISECPGFRAHLLRGLPVAEPLPLFGGVVCGIIREAVEDGGRRLFFDILLDCCCLSPQ